MTGVHTRRHAVVADKAPRRWCASEPLSHLNASPLSIQSGESYVKAIHYLWVPLLLLLAATGEVSAQSTVESRVQKLEETIRVLERRVADLEEQLRERSAPAPVASDKVKWRKLKKGMTEGDVEKLLGSPLKVDAYGPFTIWHYSDRSGGEVEFDGRSNTVKVWHEP